MKVVKIKVQLFRSWFYGDFMHFIMNMFTFTCITGRHYQEIRLLKLFTGAQPKAGTGHKMQMVSVFFSTLHCEGYTTDLRYIAGSLLLGVLAGSLKSYPPF